MGTVDKVGSGVTNVKEGDRVAGFVHGGAWEGEGWAEYIKAQASLVWKVPDNLNDLEAAAAAGVGPCASRRLSASFMHRVGLMRTSVDARRDRYHGLLLPPRPQHAREPGQGARAHPDLGRLDQHRSLCVDLPHLCLLETAREPC